MPDDYGNDDQLTVDTILEAWPEAKPFQDLIQATDVESYAAVAREIALKVRGIKSNGSGPKPSFTRATTPNRDKAVSVEQAIKAKNWPDYLAAKFEKAQENDRG